MKPLFSIIFFYILILNTQAQTAGLVRYEETFKNFIGTHEILYDLYFNIEHSVYLLQENPNDPTRVSKGSFAQYFPSLESEDRFFYRKLGASYIINNENTSMKYYTVLDDSLNINWDIKNEYKNIGGFACQQANTSFRGRNYTAWFTEEIPVDFGPMKFGGLPGLILEIYDDEGVIHIAASEININNDGGDIDEIVRKIDLDVDFSYQEFLDQRCIDALAMNKIIESKMGRGANRIISTSVGNDENVEKDYMECGE
ncbi:MAG: GLPGLI family protein [Flavobacteriaceae bacterium]|nr:GLPGLI family protein [Flavobacteriaceae bacterium]